MSFIRLSCCFAVLMLAVLIFGTASSARLKQADPRDEKVRLFEDQVRPILKKNCYSCHTGSKAKGKLRLDYRGGLLKGGESGPAVDLKQPGQSLLLEAINYESYEMPPKGKLPREQIDVLTRWVKQGVPWTPGEDKPPPDAEATSSHEPPQVNEQTRRHWSFQRIKRPAIPRVKNSEWVKTPIDAFILAKLESEGLKPALPADKVTLIRRSFYNLIGLPPSPEEVKAFLADQSPDAFEKLVDRLLESPHYGEKWARHWLDLVRYAETNSYERDGAKPFVWRYRDYVIRSLNEDKPYDQFIREQLAGDELDETDPESVIATGYYRLGVWDDEPVDPLQAHYDDLDDILSTTGQVFLGLTIGCARCHDHKLDPIPQADYYRMLAFFNNIRRYGVRAHETVLDASVSMVGPPEKVEQYNRDLEQWKRNLRETERELRKIERAIRPLLKGGERDDFKDESARIEILRKRVPEEFPQAEFDNYVTLSERRDRLRKSEPEGLMQVLCVKEHGPTPRPTHVLIRGNAHVKGEPVGPAFPEVLGFPNPEIDSRDADAKSSGQRKILADWIAGEDNPLTARVMANRIWQHHFSRGIVRSPNDLGLTGDRPTHPALLDWLAAEFMKPTSSPPFHKGETKGGWSIKRMHKLIMMSSAYQMSSRADKAALERDPQNELLWRQNMRRLTAEEIRDSILAVNGSLNRKKMYGPSIFVKIPKEVLAGQSRPGSGWGESQPSARARRSIYIHVKRSLLTPILSNFDFPEPDLSCPDRFVSTQPTQSLGMLNSEFINEQAAVFADFLRENSGDKAHDQVKLALQRVMQRESQPHEIDRGVKLIEQLQKKHNVSSNEALQQFCLLALNLNEFFYLD